jgi:LysM repeat protein
MSNEGGGIVKGFRENEETDVDDDVSDYDDVGVLEENEDGMVSHDDSAFDTEKKERDRYRREFLRGYTDVRRRGMDMTGNGDFRKKGGSGAPAGRSPVQRDDKRTQPEEIREEPVRRTGGRPAGRDYKLQQAPARKSSSRGSTQREDIDIIARRTQRPERRVNKPQLANFTGGLDVLTAPIFKIIAGVFLLMLIIMIFLIVQINGANSKIEKMEETALAAEENTESLSDMQMQLDGLKQQNQELTDENNRLGVQLSELTPSADPEDTTPGEDGTSTPDETGTNDGGQRTYTVVTGDSLSRISQNFYGDLAGIDRIKEANDMSNDSLTVGQEIVIPQ